MTRKQIARRRLAGAPLAGFQTLKMRCLNPSRKYSNTTGVSCKQKSEKRLIFSATCPARFKSSLHSDVDEHDHIRTDFIASVGIPRQRYSGHWFQRHMHHIRMKRTLAFQVLLKVEIRHGTHAWHVLAFALQGLPPTKSEAERFGCPIPISEFPPSKEHWPFRFAELVGWGRFQLP